MEIYNATASLKSGNLRVTKSIGALVIQTDQAFADLVNEKISIHIERANGSNEEICTNILLSAFLATAVFGEGQFTQVGTAPVVLTALCELANNGSISLGENESIVIALSDLKSARTYIINGIEMPISSNELLSITEKVFLNGQKNRVFDIANFDECHLVGDFEKVRLSYPTNEGVRTIELSKYELKAIANDMTLLGAGSASPIADVCFSVVGVQTMEIFASNQVNIILRDISKFN